jgi:hypothetical protein
VVGVVSTVNREETISKVTGVPGPGVDIGTIAWKEQEVGNCFGGHRYTYFDEKK